MIEHPSCDRSFDRRQRHRSDVVAIVPVSVQTGRVYATQRDVMHERMLAQASEDRTADREDQQATTGRGRDKRACHVGIQIAGAICLSPCRSVGRGQVGQNSASISERVHAQALFAAVSRLATGLR
jgi:hypothetical protein